MINKLQECHATRFIATIITLLIQLILVKYSTPALHLPSRGRLNLTSDWIIVCYITGVAKVRPSKDFLRPLCQILDAQLSYLWCIYVWKYPKFILIYIFRKEKIRLKNFLQPALQYFNEIWPTRKKSLATPKVQLCRSRLIF
jgi:hypothetical protein